MTKASRPDGVTLIAIYYFLISIPTLIGACAILAFAFIPVADTSGQFAALFGIGIGFLTTLVAGLVAIVAGWGLLGLREWARWLAIALAIFSLLAFPIGTVIGGLIIWYLLQDQVRAAFLGGPMPPEPPKPAAPPQQPEPPA
jgi:hypothetical protein